jgi:hypothetical protein
MKTLLIPLSACALLLSALAQQYGSNQPIGTDPGNQSDLSRIIQAGVNAFTGGQQQGSISLDQVTSNWNQKAREAARQMFDKYGAPQEVTSQRLIWHNNGPWKMTEVVNEDIPHGFPVQHSDVLKQTLAFDVPAEMFTDLAKFDGSIIAERTKGELSARCDREEHNFIALNLANDVITGRLSVQQARSRYSDLVQAVRQGQQPTYATGVQFNLPVSSRTGDPDRPGQSVNSNNNNIWLRIGC